MAAAVGRWPSTPTATADDGAVEPITFGADIIFENDNVLSDVEHVVGGTADDQLSAARMLGGAGADLLLDRPGAQRFSGGPDDDEASYRLRVAAIQADADGAAGDDGADGEVTRSIPTSRA